MSVIATRRLERPGGSIAFERVGSGAPLLLLPATLVSAREMRRLAMMLAETFTVVSVDRRGIGGSLSSDPASPGPIDVADHVADLADLIEQERLAAAVAVGHSYGGCLALELAARVPEAVTMTWLYEPPYAPVASDTVRARLEDVGRRTLAAARQPEPGAAAEAFIEAVEGPGALAALSSSERERIRGLDAAAVAEAPLLGFDADGLSAIRGPVLVNTGIGSRPQYADIAEALVRHIPDARHQVIEARGHMAPLRQPRLVADSIEAFVRR